MKDNTKKNTENNLKVSQTIKKKRKEKKNIMCPGKKEEQAEAKAHQQLEANTNYLQITKLEVMSTNFMYTKIFFYIHATN